MIPTCDDCYISICNRIHQPICIINSPGPKTRQVFFNYIQCLYFSVVTFTTLGYGDYVPIGVSRVASALEAFTGSFTIALFVVVFVRKLTR